MDLVEVLFARALTGSGSGSLGDKPLEEILTFTTDGTGPTITEDKNGKPFSLKKAVVRVTLGFDADATGNISMRCLPAAGSTKAIASLYFSWTATAKAAWKGCGILEQDCGYWRQMVWGITNNGYGSISGDVTYNYVNTTEDYPVIQQFSFGAAPPAGMVIEILGVRA